MSRRQNLNAVVWALKGRSIAVGTRLELQWIALKFEKFTKPFLKLSRILSTYYQHQNTEPHWALSMMMLISIDANRAQVKRGYDNGGHESVKYLKACDPLYIIFEWWKNVMLEMKCSYRSILMLSDQRWYCKFFNPIALRDNWNNVKCISGRQACCTPLCNKWSSLT